MHMIRHFYDYYDSVAKLDQDRQVVYDRKPRIITLPADSTIISWLRVHWGASWDMWFSPHLVGFCGKVYPMLKCMVPGYLRCPSSASLSIWQFCYSALAVDSFLREHCKEVAWRGYLGDGKYNRNWHDASRLEVAAWFAPDAKTKSRYASLFAEYRSPIFVAHRLEGTGGEVILNARLKSMEFYQVVDPFTAYQELRMYLGALAQDEKPIPKIPDKVMLEAKGFDSYSFRKEKTKRR